MGRCWHSRGRQCDSSYSYRFTLLKMAEVQICEVGAVLISKLGLCSIVGFPWLHLMQSLVM
jgi:hypothetical protein